MDQIKSFKDLLVWQKSMLLVKEVYEISEHLPRKETFCLIGQMRKAAISVPSNIAEGFRRQHSKELKQFLCISRGSIAELETQLLLASSLYKIPEGLITQTLERIDHISRMLWNLLKRI